MEEKFKVDIKKIFDVISKNEIRINFKPVEDRKLKSKFGGQPNLPANFQWPYYEGKPFYGTLANRPLSFLIQIYMSEVTELDTNNLLPKSGVLSFFYEVETKEWGSDPKEKGCARVFYFEDESLLVESELPKDLNDENCFPELALSFENNLSVPNYESFCKLVDTDEIFSKYSDIRHPHMGFWNLYAEAKEEYFYGINSWSDITKLLGYADEVQNPMEEECEIVSRGFISTKPLNVSKDIKEEIKKNTRDWILLFQMGTVYIGDFELLFGDCGQIYFWIKKEDLEKRNFDNVWLILQC